ncbi:MAG: hypothetical protein HY914_02960 [Desulfomonile tiedjei]|nr:hypothetical protein [Desulfomonile tiedjei]
MKGYGNGIARILLIAGVVEIVLGLSHFVMPYFAYQSKGFALLNPHEINLVTLAVAAIGILLIAFGAVTILFSLNTQNELLFAYAIIQSILWSARIILEILYPVQVSLFFIDNPAGVVMALLIAEWLLFILAAIFIRMDRRTSDEGNAAGIASRSPDPKGLQGEA